MTLFALSVSIMQFVTQAGTGFSVRSVKQQGHLGAVGNVQIINNANRV